MWPLKGSRLISVALLADGVLLSADSLFQPLNKAVRQFCKTVQRFDSMGRGAGSMLGEP